MLNSVILETCDIKKSFGKKEILKDLNYKFLDNKIYAIVGKSGSGKTTLLNILGLIDENFEGKIILDNCLINNKVDRAEIRANKIGFVFQSFYLIDELTVKENILLPLKYSKGVFDEYYFNNLVDKLNISKLLDEHVNYLSGGEKQRVAIARALINKPKLIICDEPTGNLDENNASNVIDIIRSFIDKNRTIIIVTHSENIAKQCDVNLELFEGELHERKI